ncbi:hypothetical protein SAMN03159443_01903 [Pseudomonas sp. NFACC15-1]|uniref:DUF5677 domain-containing protein n=1 Tax=unclassified Pseudomonas TaxID=196821 RepID=UPI0008902AF9|nr:MULTISPECIES: DUF5677 domain-containing protein [unclassified Pseudomonas]SDA63383.1 hypothetical protein SAMN03159443_01903 [Pseudomonas sp. NFACC15-1]SDX92248.1 hypothetical protein SAMN03159380_03108 [Pseudomonas sp. NFACC14]
MSKDNSEDFIKSVQRFSARHSEHKKHLPTLNSCLENIIKGANELQVGRDNPLPFILKVETETLLHVVTDLNSSLLLSLSNELYSSVEALSRIALENTINLMYINEDTDTKRGKSLLKSYLTSSWDRAEKWLDFAMLTKDENSEQRARAFFDNLKFAKDLLPLFRDPKVKGWSDARARFKAVGLESLYHILYAPTCNSVHSFSEDIYNNMLFEHTPPELQPEIFKSIEAEKTSFAYYLTTNAVLLYADAVLRLAIKLKNKDVEGSLLDARERLWSLINEHEALTDEYYKAVSDPV